MPQPHWKLTFPNLRKDLIALWKDFGPGWMLAALVAVMVPLYLFAGGFFLQGLAELLKLLR